LPGGTDRPAAKRLPAFPAPSLPSLRFSHLHGINPVSGRPRSAKITKFRSSLPPPSTKSWYDSARHGVVENLLKRGGTSIALSGYQVWVELRWCLRDLHIWRCRRQDRSAFGVLLIGITLATGCWVWLRTRTLIPLNVPIALSRGHLKSQKFSLNLDSGCYIEIEVYQVLDNWSWLEAATIRMEPREFSAPWGARWRI
jgi:hypothetical protein